MSVQSREEFEHQSGTTLQRPHEAGFVGCRLQETQLGECLVRGATGDQKEPSEIRHGPTTTPLGYVGHNRLGRAD